ncbi:polysaccharide biosynthesis/export family protein [Variovorax sp. J22P240]|uniref:polysaccharide biosynthesis/export family protein n=1 Tax=Variovorax sp. J22P240 TaxID=3053514 RepID=UPI002575C021|nr:polysaccharide biosynthesis/export family protein [Variovorax sp. J22P240]MDL9998100.1 polysaccharide biosynthesis/export family protein [Variovorax sp. J22P240]
MDTSSHLTSLSSLLRSLLPIARWPALASVVALVAGCAFAPGMSFDETAPDDDARTSATAMDAVADPAPAGALQKITPELIRRQRAAQATDVGEDVKRLYGVAKPYRIGSGDILNIVVWDHPDLVLAPAGSLTTDATSGSPVSNGYNVSADGLIQFPYVGPFKVGGLTEYEVRERLAKALAKFFEAPKLTVRIQSYRNGRVYVDGAVRTPGLQAVNDIPMTLPEAINRAGGFATDADRSMVSISRDGVTSVVNMQQLTTLGVNPANILLGAGDLVRVYSRDDAKVYVLGEVTRPMAQPLRNGRLTLNEALGEAGGVSTTTGEPRQIYVVRSSADGTPEIYHLDAKSPVAYAMAEGFELKPRDVVYVDPAALVRWNRVISMILPSAQVMNVGNTMYK